MTSLALIAALAMSQTTTPTHTFAIKGADFVLDGKPFQIRSGEMHYQRVPRPYWRDRFKKMKAMGLNAICTYIFWNAHEMKEGKFDFSGNLDVAEFIKEAQQEGLWVIIRPGPYVCAEWEWGGFPWWLANQKGIKVRQNDPIFLKFTDRYYKALGKQLGPLTVKQGGPIIMCQVENEYGSFGNDHEYMGAIHKQVLESGIDCQLYTADGSLMSMLQGGTLPDLPAAVNFGGGAEGEFANFAKFRKDVPLMNGEFWCGWFDHWGDGHAKTSVQGQADDLEWMHSRKISFNLYMFHGGTSWGFMNGSNSGGKGFEPDITSYDYDAPVSEDGRLTPKYFAFRDVIQRHLPPTDLTQPPADVTRITFPQVGLQESCSLLDEYVKPVRAAKPMSMEELGHGYGFVLYRTKVGKGGSGDLKLENMQDRAFIYVDDHYKGMLQRRLGQDTLHVDLPDEAKLDILIENQGRINFSRALLGERKGITGANFKGAELGDWEMISWPFEDLKGHRFEPTPPTLQVTGGSPPPFKQTLGPTLYRGSFTVGTVGDTYIDMRGWGTGNVWVNGRNLGRFWNIGPQQSLYLPAPFMKKGQNDIVILDILPRGDHVVQGVTDPIWENPKK